MGNQRIKLCCMMMLVISLLAGLVSAEQMKPLKGTNVLAGKKATFSLKPNYQYSEGGDETDLTDGKFWQFSGGKMDFFWTGKGTVGWLFGYSTGVMITFDLGTAQPIKTLGFDTAASGGRAGVAFPAAVFVYVSNDGKEWHYVTNLINEALSQSDPSRNRFVATNLKTGGQHVAFYVVNGGDFAFADEIEAIKGDHNLSQVVFKGDKIAGDKLEADALNRAKRFVAPKKEDKVEWRKFDNLERYVAIDNKCAWPNLTLMPDGSIIATIFSQPTHHQWEGDIECWISTDGGKIWSFLSTVAPHAPGTNQICAAVGLTHSGSLVALVSGMTNVPAQGKGSFDFEKIGWLAPKICRSDDGGKSWTRTEMKIPSKIDHLNPFGNIIKLPAGRLAVSCYSLDANDIDRNTSWMFFSDDDGRTWGNARPIGTDNYNETALLSLDGKKLLAAIRTITWGKKQEIERLEMFASDDGGQTWTCRGPVSLAKQLPANLIRLQDGSILMTYGSRLFGAFGVHARISRDDGLSWDVPRVLFNTPVHITNTNTDGVDGGYPSSVQLEDGTIVTAYYCSSIPMHQRYHMGVVRWQNW